MELSAGTARLLMRNYGENILAETAVNCKFGELYLLKLRCIGQNITAWLDGDMILEGVDDKLFSGGAGVFYENAP